MVQKTWRTFAIAVAALSACTSSESPATQGDSAAGTPTHADGSPPLTSGFIRIDLVSDQPGAAPRQDPDLVNSWGIAPGEGGFWIADNGTGKLSIYDGAGLPSSGEYKSGQIMLEPGIDGIVANHTGKFQISGNGITAPADFIVASETGKLWGVNGDVDATGGVIVADHCKDGAVYKGVAILAPEGAEPELLAADFHNARLDVYDARFKRKVSTDRFKDPALPAGFAPFNVAVINGMVFVAYALQDADAHDDVPGPGLGAIDIYAPSGALIQRFATGGALDAPWAMLVAPAKFGSASGALLVGNFGDGRINTFDLASGKPQGPLAAPDGTPIMIDGLWGISVGDGIDAGNPNKLYFVAGPNEEADGLYGRIELEP